MVSAASSSRGPGQKPACNRLSHLMGKVTQADPHRPVVWALARVSTHRAE